LGIQTGGRQKGDAPTGKHQKFCVTIQWHIKTIVMGEFTIDYSSKPNVLIYTWHVQTKYFETKTRRNIGTTIIL
jgi:hypothetical protein